MSTSGESRCRLAGATDSSACKNILRVRHCQEGPNDYSNSSRHLDSCIYSHGTLRSTPIIFCSRLYKAEETDGGHRLCY